MALIDNIARARARILEGRGGALIMEPGELSPILDAAAQIAATAPAGGAVVRLVIADEEPLGEAVRYDLKSDPGFPTVDDAGEELDLERATLAQRQGIDALKAITGAAETSARLEGARRSLEAMLTVAQRRAQAHDAAGTSWNVTDLDTATPDGRALLELLSAAEALRVALEAPIVATGPRRINGRRPRR